MKRCQQFRDRWLESTLEFEACDEARVRDERDNGHASACPACADWLRSTNDQVRALRTMGRVELPEVLGENVNAELFDPTGKIERALRSLRQLEAPTELDELVSAALVEGKSSGNVLDDAPELDSDGAIKSVAMLDYALVPPVLERLVNEELAQPKAHIAERFVGNLEPRPAPQKLMALVQRELRVPLRSRLSGAVMLAAATLVVWLLIRPAAEPEIERPRRLRVVHASSVDQLDPLVRELLSALGGGSRDGGRLIDLDFDSREAKAE